MSQQWDDDDILDQITPSTVAVVLMFGSITFVTTAMAARTWLLGDNRAILAAIFYSPSNKEDIRPLELSFMSIFVLLYHITLFGLILFAAYIFEHHPPFPHQPRDGFDPDYLVFLVLMLILYSWLSGKLSNDERKNRNNNIRELSMSTTSNQFPNNDADNKSFQSGVSGKSNISNKSDGSVEEIDFQQQDNRTVLSRRSNASNFSGKSAQSTLEEILLDDDTIVTPSVAASTIGTIYTQTTGHTGATGYTGRSSKRSLISSAEGSGGSGGSRADIMEDVTLEDESAVLSRPKNKKVSNAQEQKGYKVEKDVLNADQSLEWKGVLSSCFLIYQLTAAETYPNELNLYYNAARVGASCFVFLTGFGHSIYFYTRGDYKLVRVVRVLCRINFGAFWLCFTLGRPYIFYYVCPLHSLHFMIVYGSMRAYKALNYSKYGLRIKFIGVACIIFLIWDLNLGLFQLFSVPFFPSKPPTTGVPYGPLWEWYYQTYIHHWVGFIGMIYAINYPVTTLWLSKIENLDIQQAILLKGVVGVALALAFGLWVSGPYTTMKYAFDSTQPYFGFLPILCYLYFRNITKSLRERHLTLFRSLGVFALEVYLLHHHFFLSSDGATLLVLLPGYPKCNVILISLLLLFVARMMNKVTTIVCQMVFPIEKEAISVRAVIGLGVSATIFYAIAFALESLGIMNMASMAVIIIAVGLILYSIIMGKTWQDYRRYGLESVQSSNESSDESPVTKISAQLIGAMVIFFLATCWHLFALVGATGTDRILPMQCDVAVNDGIWAPVNACSEYQRAHDTREYMTGGYYRDCSDVTNLQWGWRNTVPGSHCRFRSRDVEEMQRKLNRRTVVFIGDSTVRNLFNSVGRALGDVNAGRYDAKIAEHADIGMNVEGVHLEYKWAPLARDMVTKLKDFRLKGTKMTNNKFAGDAMPDMIVVGGGILDSMHVWATDESSDSHKEEVQKVAKELKMIRDLDIPTIWCTPTTINTQALSNDEKRNQMNERAISEMRTLYADLEVENSAAFVLDGPSYSRGRVAESWDGIHYPLSVYDAAAQIFANALDWLVVDNETLMENFDPPTPGVMCNPFLGLMMMCFCLIGLLFFDGYFGFSYLASLLVKGGKNDSSSAIMPNDLYEEAFGLYHRYLKFPGVDINRSTMNGDTSGSRRSSHPSSRQSQKTIEDSDILSLLGDKSTGSTVTKRSNKSGGSLHEKTDKSSVVSFQL